MGFDIFLDQFKYRLEKVNAISKRSNEKSHLVWVRVGMVGRFALIKDGIKSSRPGERFWYLKVSETSMDNRNLFVILYFPTYNAA